MAAGLAGGLFSARVLLQVREVQQRSAEPGPLVQHAPSVTLLDRVTSRRSITGTTDLVERLAQAPEMGDVIGVSDRVTRDAGEVTLAREVVRRVSRPLPLLRSSIDTAFPFSGETYQVAFGATYEFENPDDSAWASDD